VEIDDSSTHEEDFLLESLKNSPKPQKELRIFIANGNGAGEKALEGLSVDDKCFR
jgi:hypothetical protein